MTPTQRYVLLQMVDGEEMVAEGCIVYVDDRRTSYSVLRALLRLCAIKDVSDVKGGVSRYVINEIGQALLRRPELEDEIWSAILSGGAFTIRDDRVVVL